MTKKETKVEIKDVDVKTTNVKIEAMSNLLIHKFADSSKKDMVAKQTGKTKQKEQRNIDKEVEECIYRDDEGNVGFPASGFKKAMVEVAPYLTNLDKKLIKGSVYVTGNLIPIKFKKQKVNEAVVRLGGVGKTAMVRYRPEFEGWSAELPIMYDASTVTPQQIVSLVNMAGFHIGVGDWRPQCSGSFGMFRVAGSTK